VGVTLHEGRYAAVKQASHRDTGTEHYLRAISKTKTFMNDDSVLREVAMVTKLKHNHIMSVVDSWETPQEICLVMEPTEVRPPPLTPVTATPPGE